jgi:hypothetical protein
MVIDVGDQRRQPRAVDERACRDGRVVEEAEAHPARGFGVMAGWADERERRAIAGNDTVERRKRSARGTQRAVVRGRVDLGIAGREQRVARGIEPFAFALRAFDVGAIVNAHERRELGDAHVDPLAEHAAPLQLHRTRAHPVGAFRVRNAGQMARERFVVRDQHGQW